MVLLIFLSLSLMGLSPHSKADEYGVIRRVVVFPILVPEELAVAAEEAWWAAREQLTRNKRFLLASKYFMQQKDVFQPRGALSPADAIILGKLLDAHALIVTYMQKNTLKMIVYSGEDGSLFWRQQLQLHPSVRLGKQLTKATTTLINDFLAAFPYQGVHIVDPLIGQTIFEEDSKLLAKVDIGERTKIQKNDEVQWIKLTRVNLEPLFSEGGRLTVIAEGRVVRVEEKMAVVELLRAKDATQIKEGELVRFPMELKHLKEEFAIGEELQRKIEPQFISPELGSLNSNRKNDRPLASSLAWIGGLLAYLLLAF